MGYCQLRRGYEYTYLSKVSDRFSTDCPALHTRSAGNAYESGGVYQYVLIDVETNPTVKLIDVRIAEQIQELSLKLRMYRDEHQYPPFKK